MEAQKPQWDEMYCSSCGSIIKKRAEICIKCGVRVALPSYSGVEPQSVIAFSDRSRLTAGILGVLLGFLGVHSFYLGRVGKGIIQIVVTVLTLGVGGLWGFIEGIIILTGSRWADSEGKLLRKYDQ